VQPAKPTKILVEPLTAIPLSKPVEQNHFRSIVAERDRCGGLFSDAREARGLIEAAFGWFRIYGRWHVSAPSEQPSAPPSPQPPASDTQGEAKPEPSSLAAQINVMRAQAERQQQPQLDPLAAYLASIPGLTIPKFHFLYHYFAQRPHLLNADHWGLLKAAHDITLGRGVQEDTGEYFSAMGALLHQHAAMPSPAPAPAPAPPMPEPMQPPMTHIDVERTESHDSEPELPMPQNVSAPPSRGSEHYAMSDEPSLDRVRLTPEERDIAARTGISELKYAEGKMKLAKMKQSKLISE
jgi:hypothetical protein